MLPFTELRQISAVSINNTDILRLHEEWQGSRGKDGSWPILDFDPATFWCARDVMLLERRGEDDFEYRHYGDNVARAAGFSMAGQRTSDFQGELGDFFVRKYLEVLESGEPLYTTHRAVRAKDVVTWERLILPLRGRGRSGPFLLVYNRPMAFANELLASVLDASPDSVMVLDTVEDAGRVSDFTLGMINKAAASEFGLTSDAVLMQRASPVLPDVFDATLLGVCAEVARTAAGRKLMLTRAASGRTYRVTLAPLSRGVVVNFTDVTELTQANERLQQLATTDALTGLANRRHLLEVADVECQRSLRHGNQLSLLMLDLDEFKLVNDRYGHAVGDRVLCAVADILVAGVRVHDVAGRLGGEEFAVVLPDTPLEPAGALAERLRATVAAAAVPVDSGEVRFTTSIGVAARRGNERDIAATLARADEQLYRAKAAGRNCVRIAPR